MTTITLTATITSNIIKGGGGPQIPPSNLTAPLISGSAVVGQTLSVSDGTWAGSPAPTFSYQWKRNGSNIGGAIGNTYTLDQADATKVITCEVTATNIAGSASALSSNSLTVLDADASAFITAASITNSTQITAINVLTNDLKGYNIWSKMKAIYPFVGGTASSHKWNLKDPRDLDVAFRLVFNGGWTHSSTGSLPNGTNAFADTKLNPNTILLLNSSHCSFYSRTNQTEGNFFEIGSSSGSTVSTLNGAKSNRLVGGAMSFRINSSSGYLDVANTDSKGFYIGNRISSTSINGWKNGFKVGTKIENSTSLPTFQITISAIRTNSGIQSYSAKEQAFATIGDGFTDTDATNLSWITEQYQTTLGRSVNPWYNNGNLLLDNYPSAAVAYSVRKLRNYYIGAAIRVRRSSDNAEQDIYFDSTGNLDTASLLSFVGAGNGFVTTWYDQSGNGNNAKQITAANQPQIVSSGSIVLEGTKPAFTGNGIGLTTLNSVFSSGNANYTTFHVINPTSNVFNRDIYFQGNASANQAIGFRKTAANQAQHFWWANDFISTQILTVYNLSSTAWNGTLRHTTINNVNQTNTPSGTKNTALTTATIGAINGSMQEYIIYNSDQIANRTAISTNINSYFNIYP